MTGPTYDDLPPPFRKAADRLALSVAGRTVPAGALASIIACWHAEATRRFAELMPGAPIDDMAVLALVVVEAAVERLTLINAGQPGRA